MRFTMSTDEKKSTDVASFVIAQPETSPEKKSYKKTVIIAVTSVVVAALVLVAILVGVYIFSEAEKEIVKISLQLKDNMKQDVSQNPNTNTVQFHVQQKDNEAWIINDYNADLKVMKIKSASGTNCYVTPLNESSPTDLEALKSHDAQQNANIVTVIYDNTGVPIKDTSFLSKTARDSCNGISTYWLYPTCNSPASTVPRNLTDMSNNRQKRATYYYATCGGYYFPSTAPFTPTCVYFRCGQSTCYTFTATFASAYIRLTNPMYRCSSCCFGGCYQISPSP